VVSLSITEAEYIADCEGQKQPIEDLQIPVAIPTYRAPLPLSPATSPRRTLADPHHTREGQSCRQPNQAHPYEPDISLESELAEFDWGGYLGIIEEQGILQWPSWLDEILE